MPAETADPESPVVIDGTGLTCGKARDVARGSVQVAVDPAGHGHGHGLRLLRSHAGGAGPMLGGTLARAMLAVRLNQLAAGGSGVDPALLPVLAEALNRGLVPPVRTVEAIGTGDWARWPRPRSASSARVTGRAGRCRPSRSIRPTHRRS